MKLTKVEIKNYRSLYHDYDADSSFCLELGDGVNAITGPNNAGKSNIFRALALALDPRCEFDRRLDMPAAVGRWSKPVVTLDFQVARRGASSQEQTLLRRLEEYERATNGNSRRPYASDGIVRLRALIEGGEDTRGMRRRVFVARGAGAVHLADDDPLARRSFEQFDKCLQFVLIRSGESLESLLEGRFSEVLQAILRDDLREAFDAASASRDTYVAALQDGMLQPLRRRIDEELQGLFPEVRSVALEPDVRPLEQTLTGMRVSVADAAATDLSDKGTGVRGGLIVAMLQHLAQTSKQSIVFAVEEPESFLHPAAQEQLRGDLERLSVRRDVSLLVTTHSPHIVSRAPEAKTFAIRKEPSGRTALAAQATGPEPLADTLGDLFRSGTMLSMLDRAERVPQTAQAVLIVEGETDRSWLTLAAQRAKRPDLLEGLSIVASGDGVGAAGAGGAPLVVMQALVMQAVSGLPVAVLLDNDDSGMAAYAMLRSISEKTRCWNDRKQLFTYRLAFRDAPKTFPYEAEDLWPDELHSGFLDSVGEEGYCTGWTLRPKPEEGRHVDYLPSAKPELAAYLEQTVRQEHCARWVGLLAMIRAGIGLADGAPT